MSFWPLSGGRRNDARESPSLFSFHHLIRQVALGVMKIIGFDVDFGVEGVFVEENRASSVMGHVEPICANVIVDILRCFLWRDDVPTACDLLLEGIFLSASRSWIPVVHTKPLLHGRTIRQNFC